MRGRSHPGRRRHQSPPDRGVLDGHRSPARPLTSRRTTTLRAHPQVSQRSRLRAHPLMSQRKRLRAHIDMNHRDGTLTEVLYNASLYRDAADNVLGVFAAARDVTEQKQAAQYSRSLLEAALDPLVTISPAGTITDVNEATVNVTGIGRSELIGTNFSEYFTEPDKANEGYQLVFDQGSVTDYPLTLRHRDGTLTEVLYNARSEEHTSEHVLGVFAAARDVTEQKRALTEIAHPAKALEGM